MFKKNLIFPRSQFPASFHDLLIILRKILKKPQLALSYLNALLKTFPVYLFKKNNSQPHKKNRISIKYSSASFEFCVQNRK